MPNQFPSLPGSTIAYGKANEWSCEFEQKSVRGEEDVLRAVQSGALSIASVLLYPKTLGGCAVFSGFLPFASSFASRVTPEAKKVCTCCNFASTLCMGLIPIRPCLVEVFRQGKLGIIPAQTKNITRKTTLICLVDRF
jgi:hypothetical protein